MRHLRLRSQPSHSAVLTHLYKLDILNVMCVRFHSRCPPECLIHPPSHMICPYPSPPIMSLCMISPCGMLSFSNRPGYHP